MNKTNVMLGVSLGMVLLIGILLVFVKPTNAGELTAEAVVTSSKVITASTPVYLKEDFNTKYGTIAVADKLGTRLVEYSLINNTEQCLINCEAYGKAVLYSDGKLFEGKEFISSIGTEVLSNSQFWIKVTDSYQVEDNVYKEVCAELKNTTKQCTYEVVEYKNKTEYNSYWEKYNYEVLKAGNYEWKLTATKGIKQNIDFQLVSNGQTLKQWAWWNSSWEYKREVTITENSGSSLTNYSTLIYVPYSANMKTDFSDLRFTDSTETEELGYWIENKTDSSFAYIWVKIPTLTASQNTSIYMYYQNSSVVTTKSSFNNAFVFADDFESSLNANWLQKRGTWSTTGGYLTKSTATDDIIVWNASLLNLVNYTVTVNIDNSLGVGWEGVAIRTNNDADYYSIQTDVGNNNIAIEKWLNNAFSSVLATGTSATTGNMNITAKAVGTNISFYENGVYKMSITDGALSSGSVGIVNYQSIKGKFYWIKVQPYTSVEPTYVIGNEQIIYCNFSGYVKDASSNGLQNAQIVVFNQDNKSETYNTTSSATGYWTINIKNSTKNYTAVAYFNNSLIGQAKPFIRGTC